MARLPLIPGAKLAHPTMQKGATRKVARCCIAVVSTVAGNEIASYLHCIATYRFRRSLSNRFVLRRFIESF